MEKDPAKRLTIDEALKHEFVSTKEGVDQPNRLSVTSTDMKTAITNLNVQFILNLGFYYWSFKNKVKEESRGHKKQTKFI